MRMCNPVQENNIKKRNPNKNKTMYFIKILLVSIRRSMDVYKMNTVKFELRYVDHRHVYRISTIRNIEFDLDTYFIFHE